MNKTNELECQYFIELENGKITKISPCYKEQNGEAKLRDLEINGQQIALCDHHYGKVTAGEK
tara:strand:+ start:179 stop:364 length:186 start_codon:yes stop_codon:yes gene_type:complete